MSKDYPAFLGSEIESCAREQAAFSVIPVPYERTVSYGGGTARGPLAILEASWQLETWDGYSNPSEGGIHTCSPVDCEGAPATVMDRIAGSVAEVIQSGSRPVIIGGEHAITYGNALGIKRSGAGAFGVIQIDAHADLRDAYEGDRFSHASVMKRLVDEQIPIFQLGVRALCGEEVEARKQYAIPFIDAVQLDRDNLRQVKLPDSIPARVFLTIDVDGLDPSVFPSTGTPVPGGPGWYQTLALLESIASQREIIGFDMVEFAPIKGFHAYDFAAAALAYNVMGLIHRSTGQ
jgi:agmatinase